MMVYNSSIGETSELQAHLAEDHGTIADGSYDELAEQHAEYHANADHYGIPFHSHNKGDVEPEKAKECCVGGIDMYCPQHGIDSSLKRQNDYYRSVGGRD